MEYIKTLTSRGTLGPGLYKHYIVTAHFTVLFFFFFVFQAKKFGEIVILHPKELTSFLILSIDTGLQTIGL